ncbi:hypothetical protein D3C83_70070 [compost metagenome]
MLPLTKLPPNAPAMAASVLFDERSPANAMAPASEPTCVSLAAFRSTDLPVTVTTPTS